MIEQTYTVQGMTCAHCAGAVSREVRRIDGVEAVAVDVEGGHVTITSATELPDAAVAAAVDEAGYTLVAGR
ncbi:MAG: heavy-metal-associated domain-containing protein [Microbacterium sp.]|uniref:heavy-metal-associated domain-containing protein n=1 Tax=Microbacterium sp. TaxID=51671 RepID=UPI001AC966A8|nr:heavy-metal-associated domain-containing protein [Microbacterium sp.]MBN9178344.1 heavy-metal-associated domain-containing protein [Microbacterium sp.]